MTLTVEIPDDLEQVLRRQSANLDADAKEAMCIEFFRQERITRYQLSQALGISRFETDAILKKHHVTEDLPTSQELEEDLRAAAQLVNL